MTKLPLVESRATDALEMRASDQEQRGEISKAEVIKTTRVPVSARILIFPTFKEKHEKLTVPVWLIASDSRRFEVKPFTTTIGADLSNDIVLQGEGVSDYHALIFHRHKEYHVLDLDSEMGTSVGPKKVVRTELKHGDVLKIGELSLTFELGEAGGSH
ncbi:MAG: FHA domain-containing protein [Candidatus Oleimicrobiaceae bacterium]